MSNDPLCCDFCGARIYPLELTEGRAVVIFQKRYCPSCMAEAIRRSKSKRQAPSSVTPPGIPAAAVSQAAGLESSPRSTRRLKIGEHGCGLYGSEEERRAQVGPYLREGLESGEKVVYFLKMPTPEKILGDFREVGLQPHPYLQSGQLEVIQAAKMLGKSGKFVPTEMAARLLQAADRAVREGFGRLRFTGDMTWALSSLIDTEQLIEFERELSSLAVRGKCTALCQYNVYRFEASSLHKIQTSHPFIFAKGTAETVLKELAAAP